MSTNMNNNNNNNNNKDENDDHQQQQQQLNDVSSGDYSNVDGNNKINGKNKVKSTTKNNKSDYLNDDSIEMRLLTNSNVEKRQASSNTNNKSDRNKFSFRYLIDEFKTKSIESLYKKSYLPITRLFFSYYIFYLIINTTCWIIYHSIENTAASNRRLQLVASPSSSSSSSSNNNDTTSRMFDLMYDEPSNVIIHLHSAFLLLLLIVFGYLLIAEFKETRYKRLRNYLKKRILETKVDKKVAESNLKEAIEKFHKTEANIDSLRKTLNSQSTYLAKLREFYSKYALLCACIICLFMCSICIIAFFYKPHSLEPIGHYIWYCELILIIYSIYPFNVYLACIFSIAFSITFETLSIIQQNNNLNSNNRTSTSITYSSSSSNMTYLIVIKLLLNVCLHSIGIYLYTMLQIFKRNTFLNVAHMNLTQMNSEQDKKITETMIKSIMPPLFTHIFGKPEDFKESVIIEYKMRPLYVYPVANLSILFADIVGFTKMSATKTAEDLVLLLNDLYGRFDKLCEKLGCEKISTLGDCYYCVSGCLNGREDHAKCCVEMGLSMIKEIESFNKAHSVDVNMRVGVHTGKALCGFIGGKRFRFDVWSRDVTKANQMESTGRAGSVHISETTLRELNNEYQIETGEKVVDLATYFVIPDEKRRINKPKVIDTFKLQQQRHQLHTKSVMSDENNSIITTDNNNQTAAAATVNESQTINNNPNESTSQLQQQTPADNNNTITPATPKHTCLDDEDDDKKLECAAKDIEFFRPDLNFLTTCFNRQTEKQYQKYLMGYNYYQRNENLIQNTIEKTQYSTHSPIKSKKLSVKTWSNPRNTLFITILLSFIINLSISISYILAQIQTNDVKTYKFYLIIGIFFLLTILQIIFLAIYFIKFTTFFKLTRTYTELFKYKSKKPTQLQQPKHQHQQDQEHHQKSRQISQYPPNNNSNSTTRRSSLDEKLYKYVIIKYTCLHIISFLLLSLMPTYILSTSLPFKCIESSTNHGFYCLSIIYIVSLAQFCSFIQLSTLFKIILFLCYLIIYCALSLTNGAFCCTRNSNTNNINNNNDFNNLTKVQISSDNSTINVFIQNNDANQTTAIDVGGSTIAYSYVIIVELLLYLIIVFIVNRQSELVQRICFTCDQEAKALVNSSREQKDLANWLIEVVLPAHVVQHVKERKDTYSRNYECVGVLFVSLCNYGEFYEEDFMGGREFLRILNEITVDFDRLFDEPRYKNIEKIKSIGSTFMIASGLLVDDDNNTVSQKPAAAANQNQHLYDLVDFALTLWKKLESFNNDAMSVCHFEFKMKMGFNFGPVTAGVIGRERLLYDIWGDTVNVASRMDSTGQAGSLQTPSYCQELLKDKYKFELRGEVNIKGKDRMVTYFLKPSENM